MRDESPTGAGSSSIHAAVHQLGAAVKWHPVNRTTMLAISQAIEDTCATAVDAVLIGAFQTSTAYDLARPRWRRLAATASTALVLGAFDHTVVPSGGPAEVAVSDGAPVSREWAVICDAPEAPCCLVGWERPGTSRRFGGSFDAVWSVDPVITRVAARAALSIAAGTEPALTLPHLEPHLTAAPATQPERLMALTERIVANLDRAIGRRTAVGRRTAAG